MPMPELNMLLDMEPIDKVEPDEKILNIHRVEQVGDLWCWVACLVSVLDEDHDLVDFSLEHGRLAQGYIVSREKPCGDEEGCLASTIDDGCDQAFDPDEIHALWKRWKSEEIGCIEGSVTVRKIREEIAANRPVHLVFVRHGIMVDGWKLERNGTFFLHVMDPGDLKREWYGLSILSQYPGNGGECDYTLHNIEDR